AEAVRRTVAAADFAGTLGAHFIIWPGIEGYNYPFQTPYKESWAWLLEGIGQAAETCKNHGVLLFLEHKNSEPAMNILMRNDGERLGFDLYPYTEDAVAAVKRSILQWRFIDSVAGGIDDSALREAQMRKDAVRAYELVYAALGAPA